MMRNVSLDVLSMSVAAEFGLFPPLFFYFFYFLYWLYFCISVIYIVMYHHNVFTAPLHCCHSTVYSCDILLTLKAKRCFFFFKATLVKVCVCVKTLISGVISFTANGLRVATQFTTVDLKRVSAEPLFFSPLCYTANKCGAVNKQILYSHPAIQWPRLLLTLCSCELYLSLVLCGISVFFWVMFFLFLFFRTKDANKIAAYKSVCHHGEMLRSKAFGVILPSRYYVDITGGISCSHVLLNLCLTLLWIYNMLRSVFPKYLS